MIDTHSHIYGPEFSEDITQVIDRARQAGVERILLPNINEDSIAPMLCLCAAYPGYLHPMMGLHPTDVSLDYQSVLDKMEPLLAVAGHPYIAVGEIGLDFYWDTTHRLEQIDAFHQQIAWALRYDLPIVVHARSAHRELVETIRSYAGRGLTGVFHCFGGNHEEAQELLSFDGFVLGIGGVLTYKKSTLPDALAGVPLDRVVLETDAPYLSPVPYRGKRNESAYVSAVLKHLSTIYNVDVEEVERITDANARRVFRRMK